MVLVDVFLRQLLACPSQAMSLESQLAHPLRGGQFWKCGSCENYVCSNGDVLQVSHRMKVILETCVCRMIGGKTTDVASGVSD